MDVKSVVAEVASWPVDERLQVVEEIWNGLLDQGFDPELNEDLKATLERRLDAIDANPDDVVTWESVIGYVRRPQ